MLPVLPDDPIDGGRNGTDLLGAQTGGTADASSTDREGVASYVLGYGNPTKVKGPSSTVEKAFELVQHHHPTDESGQTVTKRFSKEPWAGGKVDYVNWLESLKNEARGPSTVRP